MIPRFLCVVSVLKWSILICFCITISVTWNIVRIKVYSRLFVHLSCAKIISKCDWKKWKMILTPTWFEHAAFWSGVRRATVAPRSQVVSGSTEIWTRIAGFKVQSANHYTIEPLCWEDLSGQVMGKIGKTTVSCRVRTGNLVRVKHTW